MNQSFHRCYQRQVLGSYDCCLVWLVYLYAKKWKLCHRNAKITGAFLCTSFQAINLKIKLGVQIDYHARQRKKTMSKFIEYHYYDLFGWHHCSDFHPSMVHTNMGWEHRCSPKMTLIESNPSSETLNRLEHKEKRNKQKKSETKVLKVIKTFLYVN